MPRPIRRFSILAWLLVTASTASAESAGSVSMTPPRTRIQVAPGGHGISTITISNETAEPLQGKVQLADWAIENGAAEGLRYSAPGTGERSCARWLEVLPTEFEVAAAGGHQTITLSVALPNDAEGGYFGALIVELMPKQKPAEGGVSIQAAIHLGHLITIDTEGRSTWSGSVESLHVSRPDDTKSLGIETLIRNTGNTAIRPEGSFAITDADGSLVGKVPMKTYLAQPGGIIRVSEQWDGLLEAGHYLVIGTIDLGGDQFLTPELAFDVLDKVELTGVEVQQKDGKLSTALHVANPGNITATLSGRIDVISGAATVLSLDAGSFTVLPDATLDQRFELGTLSPGNYELHVSLHGGAHELEAKQAFRSP